MWSHPQAEIILHPQEIRQQQQTPLYLTQILHSQVRSVYTPGCYIHHKTLSLRKTLKMHFTPSIYAHKKTMKRSLTAEKKQEEPTNQSKSLTDSDTSDDIEVNPRFKTSVEEKEYDTIPGSATATQIALSYSWAQANLTVECGPLCWKVKIKKPSTDKAKDKNIHAKTKARNENKL